MKAGALVSISDIDWHKSPYLTLLHICIVGICKYFSSKSHVKEGDHKSKQYLACGIQHCTFDIGIVMATVSLEYKPIISFGLSASDKIIAVSISTELQSNYCC